MKNALELLRMATTTFPPVGRQHHNLTMNDKGELVFTIMRGSKWDSIVLEESDFDRPPRELVDEFAALIKNGKLGTKGSDLTKSAEEADRGKRDRNDADEGATVTPEAKG